MKPLHHIYNKALKHLTYCGIDLNKEPVPLSLQFDTHVNCTSCIYGAELVVQEEIARLSILRADMKERVNEISQEYRISYAADKA